jgi:hypothetical protein
MLLSSAVLVLGASNVAIQLVLWVLYHSLVTVGQRWSRRLTPARTRLTLA